MTHEQQFRKDIIEGFSFSIETWCKSCTIPTCKKCLYFQAASQGHLNILREWKEKKKT